MTGSTMSLSRLSGAARSGVGSVGSHPQYEHTRRSASPGFRSHGGDDGQHVQRSIERFRHRPGHGIQAAQNFQLDSQVILSGNKTLYASSTTSWITTTTNLNAFANFAAAAAGHFKESGIVYELWNEAYMVGSTPAQFAALVKLSAAI